MGAVPVLIMLAAVGVDYGWQPDGTTSPRGDNVQYIIQIPPHQLDQIRSVGEITSTIDPAIQGRVSQVVVQIGTGPLPRDAGRALSSTHSSATSISQAVAFAEDTAQIPIPELRDDLQATLVTRPSGTARSGSEAVMKPDPQSGGFTLPEGLQTPVRTNPDVSTDPAPQRDDSWEDLSGRTAAPRSYAAVGAAPGVAPPSTDPVDPAARPQTGEATGSNLPFQSRQAAPAPATATGTAPARMSPSAPFTSAAGNATSAASNAASEPLQMPTTSAVGAAGNRPTDPSDPNWSGYGTTRNFGTLPPGLTTTGITRPSSDSQYATTSASGPASDPARTSAATAQQPASVGGQAAANEGYGRDAAGNLLDPLGRAIDGQGRLIGPQARQLVDAAGNLIDEFGRLLDPLGRPIAAEPGNTSASPGNANLQPPSAPSQPAGATGYAQPGSYASQPAANYTQPGYASPTQDRTQPGYGPTTPDRMYPAPGAVMPNSTGYPATPGYNQGGYPNAPAYSVAQGQTNAPGPAAPSMPSGYPGSTPPSNYPTTSTPVRTDPWQSGQSASNDSSRPRRNYDEDDFRSPSDGRSESSSLAGSGGTTADRDLRAPLSSPTAPRQRTVAAQPFFNFVLLISLVGNAYLIYETGNLRRKFRNMIASVRATKLAAQPANS